MIFQFSFSSTCALAFRLPTSEITNFRTCGGEHFACLVQVTREIIFDAKSLHWLHGRPTNCMVHLELHTAGQTATVWCGLSERFCVGPVCGAIDMPVHEQTVTDIIIIIIIIISGSSSSSSSSSSSTVGLKHDGTSAETRFRLSEKRTGPFESAGVSA
jgi:hypothetical protein